MAKTYTREEFVKKYGGFIHHVTKGTGILAGILVSQAIIESQGKVDGSYRVGGSKLSQNANNYFGIKCHSWKGKTYNIDTGEQNPDGTTYTDKNACFRKYDSVEDSMRDYIHFLQSNQRYTEAGVFRAKTVLEQAEALKRGGYATSVRYVDTVMSVYNGVKQYVAQYTKYKFGNAVGGFLVRNRKLILISVSSVAIGIGAYFIIKSKKG